MGSLPKSQTRKKNMKSFIRNRAFRLLAASIFLIGLTVISGLGQTPRPFNQPIVVVTDNTRPEPSPTPLVTRTGSSAPSNRKTSMPMLASVDIPGYSGILIESLDGNVVLDSNADEAFNPASNVKIATAFAVLKVFGPDFRFPTSVWTDGQLDRESGTLYGNLYVSGRDPVFNYEHAVYIASELNRLGIKKVAGDLVVAGDFVMNLNSSVPRSGSNLYATLNSATRSAAANRAWQNYISNSGRFNEMTGYPDISIDGKMYVQTVPNTAKLLFAHESAPMRAIVKATLCFSNNFLSERLGDMLGGHYAVARVVHLNANIAPEELILASSSGLGVNRVTPRAMMKLLRAFRQTLDGYEMTFADIMPVAGIDRGTLEGRFDTDFARGSVVGKTGTLRRTDNGVSTLCGEIQTRQGKVLFVIFNQRGSVGTFRNFQNSFVSLVQSQLGGAAPLGYAHIPIDRRMATSRVRYPNQQTRED